MNIQVIWTFQYVWCIPKSAGIHINDEFKKLFIAPARNVARCMDQQQQIVSKAL